MSTFDQALAASTTRIRLTFSGPIDRTNALVEPTNYLLANMAPNVVVPRILSVFVPSLDKILYVELRVANMKDGGAYAVTVNPAATSVSPITASGVPVVEATQTFTGVGAEPEILLVLADSATQATVHFSEPILDFASARDTAAWMFSGGLTVSQVLDVGKSSIVLKTSIQAPETVYTLTFNGILFDYYYNQLPSPSNGQLLGWNTPTEEEPQFRLPLAYNFLFEGLRVEDEKGGFLLRRYFEGFQVVWGAIVELVYTLKQVKDPSKLGGKPLRYLANLIGWSEHLHTILDAIDDPKMRSLIDISPQFWKDRGSPDADDGLVGLLSGARRYQLDWFDVRTIIDEMEIGEEHEGTDPWMTSVPGDGSGENDGYEYNLRIVDDGTLNRPLVRSAAKLSKPLNERVLITYLYFLDQFEVDGDFTQFSVVGADPVVDNGEMALTNGAQAVFANVEFATEWTDYLVSWRVRSQSGVSVSLRFRYVDAANNFFVQLQPAADGLGFIHLYKLVSNSASLLASFMASYELSLFGDVNHVIRVMVVNVGTTINVQVLLDGNKIIDYSEPTNLLWAPYTSGSIGMDNQSNDMVVKEVEVLRLPLESDYIDINEAV